MTEYPSYAGALEAAGALVFAYQSFGSYQGDWWAKVRLPDGRIGWVRGSFGSCSGCDALEAELDTLDIQCARHRYTTPRDVCAECDLARTEFQNRYQAFGQEYLDGFMSHEEALKVASADLRWDMEAQEMVDFINAHRSFDLT